MGAGKHDVDARQPTQLVAPGDPPSLIVNRGDVTVYVDPDQGNVDTESFPVASLASVATDGQTALYAIADPTAAGAQAVYVLPGATAYSASPSEVAESLVGATLNVTLGGATLNVAIVGDSAPITVASITNPVHVDVDNAPHVTVDNAPVTHVLLDGGQTGAGSQVHTVTP